MNVASSQLTVNLCVNLLFWCTMTFSFSYGISSAMTTSSFCSDNVYSYFVYTKKSKMSAEKYKNWRERESMEDEAAKETISHRKVVSFYWVCPPNTHSHMHSYRYFYTVSKISIVWAYFWVIHRFYDFQSRNKSFVVVILSRLESFQWSLLAEKERERKKALTYR